MLSLNLLRKCYAVLVHLDSLWHTNSWLTTNIGSPPCSGRRPWGHQSVPSATADRPLWASGRACLLRTQWSNSRERREAQCDQTTATSLVDRGGIMQATWHDQVLLFVWVGVCFVSHTTRGLRLLCRSGIRVRVRMYTPEREGERWHALPLLWWGLTASRPSFLLRSHPWCWWQSSSPTPLHLAPACAPCTLHCLSDITQRSCKFTSSRVNGEPVNK